MHGSYRWTRRSKQAASRTAFTHVSSCHHIFLESHTTSRKCGIFQPRTNKTKVCGLERKILRLCSSIHQNSQFIWFAPHRDVRRLNIWETVAWRVRKYSKCTNDWKIENWERLCFASWIIYLFETSVFPIPFSSVSLFLFRPENRGTVKHGMTYSNISGMSISLSSGGNC